MPNVMATQLSIDGALCESSVIPFLVPRPNVLADVRCWSVMQWCCQYRTTQDLWRKVNFAPGKILLGGKSPQKCIFSVAAQETAKHRAKFCWPPMSDVAAATKPRRESRWNLLGCPKLPNRSQPLVDRSSPYCEDMWRRYCCLTFSDCRYVPYLQRYRLTNLCDGAQVANFWRLFASRIFSELRAAHVAPAL